MTKEISKSFCAIPWTEPYIGARGNYGLCGMENENYNKNPIHINKDFDLHWNSEYIKSTRKEMLSGNLPPQCSACKNKELLGKKSQRQDRNCLIFGQKDPTPDNKKLQEYLKLTDNDGNLSLHAKQESFMFAVGNICQLGCVSCSSTYSSFLEKEYQQMGYKFGYKDRRTPNTTLEIRLSQTEINSNLYRILKDQIKGKKILQITGGEPFLSKHLFDFFDWCVKEGHAGKLRLFITTNGMNLDHARLEVLRQFKYVNIYMSVDGYGKVDEYVRYPSVWEEKIKNFNYIKTVVDSAIFSSTIYSLNVFGLDKLIGFCKKSNIDLYMQVLSEPQFLHMKNIPEEIKEKLITKLLIYKNDKDYDTTHIINAMRIAGSNEQWSQTLDTIKDIDTHRKLSFKDVVKDFTTFY